MTGTRVVVVNDGDVGAALAGNVIARANLGPVLASPSVGLPPDVSAEVSRLQPGGACPVGNDEALSPTVVSDLISAGVPADQVFRLAGTSPADTARIVATVDPGSREAASAAAMAAALRYPVLFAERDTLPGATLAALAALETTDTLVIGGPGTIADGVLRQLPNAVLAPGADPAAAGNAVDRAVVVRSFSAPGPGYRLVSRDGGVFAFGGAKFLGSAGALRLAQPVVGTASTPDGNGYWLVASDGGVFSFGNAAFHGSTGAVRLSRPIVAMTTTRLRRRGLRLAPSPSSAPPVRSTCPSPSSRRACEARVVPFRTGGGTRTHTVVVLGHAPPANWATPVCAFAHTMSQ